VRVQQLVQLQLEHQQVLLPVPQLQRQLVPPLQPAQLLALLRQGLRL
jgi:hypothetical protein